MMKVKNITKKTENILEFLNTWQEETHIYNLNAFYCMEFYPQVEKEDYMEMMWDVDQTQYFDDDLLFFATEGGTGCTAFWIYPELIDELPVVELFHHGEYPKFLAGSMNDLVCCMIHNMTFNSYGGYKCTNKTSQDDLKYLYNNLYIYFDIDCTLEEFERLTNMEIGLAIFHLEILQSMLEKQC